MSTYSYVTYNGDGATTAYSIPFEYVEQSDIVVSINDVVTPFTFLSATQIILPSAPASGSVVKIERETSISGPSITFADGAALLGEDMNTEVDQLLYSIQELTDTQNYWVQWIQSQTFSGGGGGGGSVTGLPPVSNANNGSVLVAWDGSWAIYSLAASRNILGIPVNGCGTVAALNIGTAAGEVPTADELGAAAWHGVGTSGTNLVQYSSFGNAAFATVGGGVGQIPALIDVGGGTAGYAAYSGQAVTNVVHSVNYTRLDYQTAYNASGGAYSGQPNGQAIPINTIAIDETGGFTIGSGGQFTIPAGVYLFRARVFARAIGSATIRLVDTGGVALYPYTDRSPAALTDAATNGGAQYVELSGRVSIGSPTIAEVQILGTANNSNTATLGSPHGETTWGNNTFATIEFYRYN
jgi:hypothetical protein